LDYDVQAALDKAFNYVSLIQVEDANYDLLQAMQTLWVLSPIVLKYRHVKDHQDEHAAIDTLDRWAKLIIEMESRAKQHLQKSCCLSCHYLISSEPWSLWTYNKKIMYDLPILSMI
jgi:hypothetical protein